MSAAVQLWKPVPDFMPGGRPRPVVRDRATVPAVHRWPAGRCGGWRGLSPCLQGRHFPAGPARRGGGRGLRRVRDGDQADDAAVGAVPVPGEEGEGDALAGDGVQIAANGYGQPGAPPMGWCYRQCIQPGPAFDH
jgi:hypothetical protein